MLSFCLDWKMEGFHITMWWQIVWSNVVLMFKWVSLYPYPSFFVSWCSFVSVFVLSACGCLFGGACYNIFRSAAIFIRFISSVCSIPIVVHPPTTGRTHWHSVLRGTYRYLKVLHTIQRNPTDFIINLIHYECIKSITHITVLWMFWGVSQRFGKQGRHFQAKALSCYN